MRKISYGLISLVCHLVMIANVYVFWQVLPVLTIIGLIALVIDLMYIFRFSSKMFGIDWTKEVFLDVLLGEFRPKNWTTSYEEKIVYYCNFKR